MPSARMRIALALVAVVVVGGTAAWALTAGGGSRSPTADPSSVVSGPTALGGDGSTAKFAFLARQTSNRCGLQPNGLAQMPDGMRLQGSCCFPMELAAYRAQVRGLRAYRATTQIPRDPYDIPVSLAKRMLAYDRAIHLGRAQAQTYSQAMRRSRLKGPCCCRCWRWYAFRGLSKYLIADRGFRPVAIAAVVDLLEGCGGPMDHA